MRRLASLLLLTALAGSVSALAATDRAREGAELVGTEAPAWRDLVWVTSEPIQLGDLRGSVVLVRFWTDTCPFCARSAGALNELQERYGERGLVVIGMHHPKPRGRAIRTDDVRQATERLGFRFPVALDRNWSTLGRYWLDGQRRRATSASFLIDRRGAIRYVHPGPAFHREVVDGDEGPRRDFAELRRMIETLLAEPG